MDQFGRDPYDLPIVFHGLYNLHLRYNSFSAHANVMFENGVRLKRT